MPARNVAWVGAQGVIAHVMTPRRLRQPRSATAPTCPPPPGRTGHDADELWIESGLDEAPRHSSDDTADHHHVEHAEQPPEDYPIRGAACSPRLRSHRSNHIWRRVGSTSSRA